MRRTLPTRLLPTVPAVLALAGLAAGTLAPQAGAIHRGENAPFQSYRFMVSLRLAEEPGEHRCGGTLIERDIVLTAAHCIPGGSADGLVAVVGADVPSWPRARPVRTVDHRIPTTFDLRVDNLDDIAVVRLAVPQNAPRIRLATAEPRVGARVLTAGWGCTSAPPLCRTKATRLQLSGQVVLPDSACGLDVFWTPPIYNARTNICTRGARPRSTVNSGDSGGPLLVRDRQGTLTQVGVTALGADSTSKLYAGFTSVHVERAWLRDAIRSLRSS